jgi:tetratricopeptide (TPR) repeat protein
MSDLPEPPTSKIPAMRHALKQVRELWEKNDYAAAKSILDQVGSDMSELGISSPSYDWALGVTLDYLDEEERALEHLDRARAADPLSPDIERSIGIVLANARRALAPGVLPVESPRVALLYRLLRRRDEADRASHLAFVKHQLAIGHVAEARALLEAMTHLYYPAADLFELIASCATLLGDAEGVVRALAEIEMMTATASPEYESVAARRGRPQPS